MSIIRGLTSQENRMEEIFAMAKERAGIDVYDYENLVPNYFDYSGKIIVLADDAFVAIAMFARLANTPPPKEKSMISLFSIKYTLAEHWLKEYDKLFVDDKRIFIDPAVNLYPLIVVDSEHKKVSVYRQEYHQWFEEKKNVR